MGGKRESGSSTPMILQPIAQRQASYLKDSTDFINFIESTEVPKHAIIVSMDVTSLYTNIPQEEGIKTICKAYVTTKINPRFQHSHLKERSDSF